MPVRSAEAEWKGNLQGGGGTLRAGSGAVDASYSFGSRFEEAGGTNPEELVAAAHAGCFAMALSHELAEAGHAPESVKATARVHLEKGDDGFRIERIELRCRARVPGIGQEDFQERAREAKENCPVSKALAGPEITLEATLEG